MKPGTKAFLYNLLTFVPIFLIFRYGAISLIEGMSTLLASFIGAIAATLLAPKFKTVKFNGVEKVMMKWIFIKGVKEV